MVPKKIKFLFLPVFFCFSRRVIIYLSLVYLTALLCVVIFPKVAFNATIEPATVSRQSHPSQSSNLVQQAKSLYDDGQFSEAIKLLQQAVQLYQEQGNRLKEAIALSDLSLAYQQLGHWPQATKAIADSFKLLQTKGDLGSSKDRLNLKAQILDTQGRLQLAQGQLIQALTTWQQAASTHIKAGDKPGFVRAQLNQSEALQSLGSYREALDLLTEMLPSLIQQSDKSLVAAGFRSLGNVRRVMGDLEGSRSALQQSLTIAQQLHSPESIGSALLGLGNLASAQQNPQSALAFYKQAADTESTVKIQARLNQLTLFLQNQQLDNARALLPQLKTAIANLPTSDDSIYTLVSLAQNLLRLRQSSNTDTPSQLEIRNLLTTAVQEAKSLGDQRALAHALGTFGSLYEQTQQWSGAQSLTQQAVILAQSINAPDIAYRWQWQLGRLLKAQGNIPEAIAAYSASVEALKILRNNLVGVNSDIQFSFREQVEPVYRQLVDLLLQSNHPSQSNLKQARETIESLQLAELDNFFRVACLEGKPVQLDQVVDQQDPTAVVIYPIILPERLGVILKLPKQPSLLYYETFISQGDVEKLLETIRQQLREPGSSSETQYPTQQLYDWLIRPAQATLASSQVKTLVFVLDGSLRNIPMAALYDGQHYLVEKYALALTPGLRLLPSEPFQKQSLKALRGCLKSSEGSTFMPIASP
jgi:tetratricopeptide (TPR) repeat protein